MQLKLRCEVLGSDSSGEESEYEEEKEEEEPTRDDDTVGDCLTYCLYKKCFF